MILLCNTFITETRPTIGKGFVDRGNLKKFSNYDIFKYSLASLSTAYDWSKVILKIKLDDIYAHKRDDLESFILNIFDPARLVLNWERNTNQHDWIKTYDLLDDNLIWFYCNHDHIFIEPSRTYINQVVDAMVLENDLCSLAFSHWPECVRTAQLGGVWNPISPTSYKIEEKYMSVVGNSFDSIQIITKQLYKEWWLSGNFNEYFLPRPDYFGKGLAEIKSVPVHKTIIPFKELCRHFDGYQHCTPPIGNNKCPAIDIPAGFFENNINIEYGYPKSSDPQITNFDPTNKNYFAYDVSGTDYKWTVDDIPLFWKPRINSVRTTSNIDPEQMLQHRLLSILNMIYYNGFPVEKIVESKILASYMSDNTTFSL
jgi:hypothetical protein